MQHQTTIILAGIIATAWIIPMAAIGDQNGSKTSSADAVQNHVMSSYLHEDHAESATSRFLSLDENKDHRLQWQELESSSLNQKAFKSVDADSSGDLDEREFVAIKTVMKR